MVISEEDMALFLSIIIFVVIVVVIFVFIFLIVIDLQPKELNFGDSCRSQDLCISSSTLPLGLMCSAPNAGESQGTCVVETIPACLEFTPSDVSEDDNLCTNCFAGFVLNEDGRCIAFDADFPAPGGVNVAIGCSVDLVNGVCPGP